MEIIYKWIFSWGFSYGSQGGLRYAWCQLSGFLETSEIAHLGDPSFVYKPLHQKRQGGGVIDLQFLRQLKFCFSLVYFDFTSYFENSRKHLVPQMKFCDKCFPISIKDNYFPTDLEDGNVFCQDDTKHNC